MKVATIPSIIMSRMPSISTVLAESKSRVCMAAITMFWTGWATRAVVVVSMASSCS